MVQIITLTPVKHPAATIRAIFTPFSSQINPKGIAIMANTREDTRLNIDEAVARSSFSISFSQYD